MRSKNRTRILLSIFSLLLILQTSLRGEETIICLAGDSTVTGRSANRDQAGWGWALQKYAKPGITIYNEAKGGRSSRSFRTEGLWDTTLAHEPDWILIQFGHNDQKGKGPERESAAETDYRDHLRQYIEDARAIGAQPILITPVCRRHFREDGSLRDTLEPYAEAVRIVAEENDVPYLDLHEYSVTMIQEMGPEGAAEFSPAGTSDRTHFSLEASQKVAGWVLILAQEKVPEFAELFENVDSTSPTHRSE
ncbi:rhamnogalacturonan acetylesterase [Puniceicoccus vermicola]|uniref:Rhamnogalacturonan acetylesterase n=1 Tax=Puniceicoccus vermicola TaxID=388746 RepID=A0A7X1B1E2_9BACT|nr:rhamnogalacturonan acetylesterase [Puniceicoccus vermicola]MBC2603851.1 rhamnogalacturonan acetylesterase [Puniceicoccus vermicola]